MNYEILRFLASLCFGGAAYCFTWKLMGDAPKPHPPVEMSEFKWAEIDPPYTVGPDDVTCLYPGGKFVITRKDGTEVCYLLSMKGDGSMIWRVEEKPLIEKQAVEEQDHEDIYAEVENGKTAEASEAMMWAIRSDPKYKWAELRWKDPEGKVLLVVRHTKPKPKP